MVKLTIVWDINESTGVKNFEGVGVVEAGGVCRTVLDLEVKTKA